MHVGGVGRLGFFVVEYQAASGCSSWDSKSLISCSDSGGLWGFLVGFVVGVVDVLLVGGCVVVEMGVVVAAREATAIN